MLVMVALLSQVIHSFRYLFPTFVPSLSLITSPSYVHHLNIPWPQVIHKELSQQFVDQFDEIVVIGDIHGCYDEMIQLLNQINDTNNNSDNNRILKLFVGDLVNKGPKSKEVLDFMIKNSNSCLSVRGNHDEVVISQYLKYEKEGETALSNKNKWIQELTPNQINYLNSLSYSISIPSLDLIVVHAGIVPNVGLKSQRLRDLVEMRNLIIDTNSDKTMKASSSHKSGVPWVTQWFGPQHIYFGHDAKRKLQISEFSTGLDTGCVYGNSMTAVFAYGRRKGSFYSVKANKVHSEPKVDKESKQ